MLLFSDDLVLKAKGFDGINKFLAILECFYGDSGLTVNVGKAKK